MVDFAHTRFVIAVIASLHSWGPRKAPAFWGEDERRREVKAYQPDMPTEHSR